MQYHFRRIILFLALFLCPSASQAQEPTDTSDDALELDPIETFADDTEDAGSDAEFDDRINHARIIEMNEPVTGLGEVLGRIPAARINDSGSRLQRKVLTYRGADAQDITVRYQGVPINALSDASADLALPPVQLTRKATLSGSGAGIASGSVGGLLDLVSDDSDEQIKASVSGSSLADFSLFSQGRLSLTPTAQIRAASFADHSPGEFHYIDAQGSRQTRTHNEASRYGAQISASADFSKASIHAFSLISTIDRQEPGLSEYPSRFLKAAQNTWLSLSRFETQFAPFAAGKSISVWKFDISHRASGSTYENPTAFIGNRPTASDYLENRTLTHISSDFLAGTISKTSISLGYDAQWMSTTQTSGTTSDSQSLQRHLLNLTIAETLSFLTDRLLIDLAFRTDWNVTESPLYSPHIAIRAIPHKTVDLWISGNRTARYPTFDENYYKTEFIRGNPDLNPQTAYNAEAGVSYHPAEWLSLSASGFYNLHKDLIRFIPITPYLYEAQNITHATVRGLEFSASSQFWLGFAIKASYAFIDAQTDDGLLLPGTPKHQTDTELSWNDDIWHASFRVSYASQTERNLANTQHLPDRLRLDASLAFRFYPGWRLSLAIYNLLDDRKSEDSMQRPLPGRYAFMTLEYAFPSDPD